MASSTAFVAANTEDSLAQAWLPEKYEGSYSASYNYVAFQGHFRSDGSRTPEAASRASSVLFDFEYGVTDRMAVSISLPFVSARYASTNPPSAALQGLFQQVVQSTGSSFYPHQFLDDGSYHGTLQDFHGELRYNVIERPFVLTPFIGLVIPSHDYAYVGESAPGRDFREFQFGTNVGRRLDPLLSDAYAHAQFAFAIPEESLNIRTNRTNISLELGYFINRKLAVRGLADWQHTFNGLHFPADLTTPEIILTHERLLKANYWHVGAGASYSLNSKTDVSVDLITFVSGSDTHYGTGVNFRITRSFSLKHENAKKAVPRTGHD